jgi:hypothetical protein
MSAKKAEKTQDPKTSATTNLEAKKETDKSASLTDDARKKKEAASIANKLESSVKAREGKKYKVVDRHEPTLKILDQGKESVRNAIEEVKTDISRYTQVAKDFQEMAIQSVKEVSDAGRQIMHSMSMLWVPNHESPYGWIWNYGILQPNVVGIYLYTVMTSAHGAFAASRLANNIFITNMEAVKILMTQFKDNVNELAKLIPGTANAYRQSRYT